MQGEVFGDRDAAGTSGGLTLHITVSNGMEALEFYKEAFGAEEMFRAMHEDGKRILHAHIRINGGSIHINDDFPEFRGGAPAPAAAGVLLHLQIDDADTWWNRAVDAGAEIAFPLADQFWSDRYGHVKDPYGHTWSIGSPVKK